MYMPENDDGDDVTQKLNDPEQRLGGIGSGQEKRKTKIITPSGIYRHFVAVIVVFRVHFVCLLFVSVIYLTNFTFFSFYPF